MSGDGILIDNLRRRVTNLETALSDLIEAAESRCPGDEALWQSRVEEAKEVLDADA